MNTRDETTTFSQYEAAKNAPKDRLKFKGHSWVVRKTLPHPAKPNWHIDYYKCANCGAVAVIYEPGPVR